MGKYIIVGVILLAGAVIEIVSWYWTKKLLDKREEGLDRRQEEIEKREKLLEQPIEIKTTRMKPVRFCAVAQFFPDDTEETHIYYKNKLTRRLLQDARQNITFSWMQAEKPTLLAELWVCNQKTEVTR